MAISLLASVTKVLTLTPPIDWGVYYSLGEELEAMPVVGQIQNMINAACQPIVLPTSCTECSLANVEVLFMGHYPDQDHKIMVIFTFSQDHFSNIGSELKKFTNTLQAEIEKARGADCLYCEWNGSTWECNSLYWVF